MTNAADRINAIDPGLIEKIEDGVPDHTWDYVINSLSHRMLDCFAYANDHINSIFVSI